MQRFFNNQKGFILILTYMLITVLIMLAGTFFMRSLNESRLVRKANDSRLALAKAEQGIAYAMAELKIKGWNNWYTHNWDKQIGRFDVSAELFANNNSSTRLGGSNRFALKTNPENPTYRCVFGARYVGQSISGAAAAKLNVNAYQNCYYVPGSISGSATNANNIFFVKVYQDWRPDIVDVQLRSDIEQSVTVIRAIGIVNGAKRAVEQRLSRDSLYRYFYFFPTDHVFEEGTFNGLATDPQDNLNKPLGKIHVNGNLGLRYANFENMASLTCFGKIYQDFYQYNPPIYYDRLVWEETSKGWNQTAYEKGTTEEGTTIINKIGEYARSNLEGAYAPAGISDLDSHFYHSSSTNPQAKINGVNIPFRAEATVDEFTGQNYHSQTWTAWDWQVYKYNYWDEKLAANEQRPITFSLSQEEMQSLETKLGLSGGIYDANDPQVSQKRYWYARSYRKVYTNEAEYQGARPKYLAQEWWTNPALYEYGQAGGALDGKFLEGSGAATTVKQVYYLDSEKQAGDWQSWTKDTSEKLVGLTSYTNRTLNQVVQDGFSGKTERVQQPEPQENFLNAAQASGIYIGLDEYGQLTTNRSVIVNQACNVKNGDDPLETDEKFRHPLYPVRDTAGQVQDTYVLDIDMDKLTKGATAISGATTEGIIVYIDLTQKPVAGTTALETVQEAINHDYTVRLYNAKTLSVPVTVVSPSQAVQLSGSFNNPADTTKWKPAAVVSYKRIETLSDTFEANKAKYNKPEDSEMILPLYYNRYDADSKTRYSYPSNPQKDDVFLQKYVYDELNDGDGVNDWKYFKIELEDIPAKGNFKWETFVKTNISDARDQEKLGRIGQAEYYRQNKDKLIPVANDTVTADILGNKKTVYNLALVTPYSPEGLVLERWEYAKADTQILDDDPSYYIDSNGLWNPKGIQQTQNTREFKGAFIRLDKADALVSDNEYLYDYPSQTYKEDFNYALALDVSGNDRVYYRQYSPYFGQADIVSLGGFSALYEGRFLNPRLRPPGDFYGASESSWIEITEQDFFRLTDLTAPTAAPTTLPSTTPPASPPATSQLVPQPSDGDIPEPSF